MKATALFLTLALIASSGTSAHAMGVNLSWDDCGTHGTCFQSFACNTNTGAPFVLIGSFVPPEGNSQVTGEEITLDFIIPLPDGPGQWPGYDIPSWWMFKNAGTCRQTALTAGIDFLGHNLASCEDYWAPSGGVGGISSYQTPYAGASNRARLKLIFAVPPTSVTALDPTLEYYAFRVAITRVKTVGTGACGGCATPLEIRLSEINLTQPVGVGNYRIQNPAVQSIAYWQSGAYGCGFVPTRNATWGAIKSQYR